MFFVSPSRYQGLCETCLLTSDHQIWDISVLDRGYLGMGTGGLGALFLQPFGSGWFRWDSERAHAMPLGRPGLFNSQQVSTFPQILHSFWSPVKHICHFQAISRFLLVVHLLTPLVSRPQEIEKVCERKRLWLHHSWRRSLGFGPIRTQCSVWVAREVVESSCFLFEGVGTCLIFLGFWPLEASSPSNLPFLFRWSKLLTTWKKKAD